MTLPLEEYVEYAYGKYKRDPNSYNILIGDFYEERLYTQHDICFMRLHRLLTDENKHNIFYTVGNLNPDRIKHELILEDLKSIVGDIFNVHICSNDEIVLYFFEKKFPQNMKLDLHFYALILSILRCIDYEYYRHIGNYLKAYPKKNIESLEDIVVMHLANGFDYGHELMTLLTQMSKKLDHKVVARSFINLIRNTCKMEVVTDKKFLNIIQHNSSSQFDGQTDHFKNLLSAYNTYKDE